MVVGLSFRNANQYATIAGQPIRRFSTASASETSDDGQRSDPSLASA